MKKLGVVTLIVLAHAGSAHAGEFSANLALTSDYVFRGISLTDGAAAIQGGFDWTGDSFYAGAWGSNVADGVEVDLYAGYTPSTGPIAWDIGAMGYFYPGADDEAAEFDYVEFKAAASTAVTGALSLGAGLYWAPENYGDTGESLYAEIGGAYAISERFTLDATFGVQSIEDPDGPFGAASEDEYSTWNIGAAYALDSFTIDLRYHDTGIEAGSDIEAYTYGPSSYDGAVVLTLSRGL